MKKLNTLLDNAQTGLAREGSEAPAGARAAGGRPGHDHVDAINQMFAEFELAYHNQFHKAYAREGSVALAKKYWLSCLSPYPPEVILRATREVVSAQEFLPTLASIVQGCDNARGLFGLPAPHDAYVEACCAPEPKKGHAWSHPAVYHAGCATDWFALATQPESKVFPLFDYHYGLLCRRVMQGEGLDIELPPALEENPAQSLSPEENRAKLRKLRKSLKL